MKNCGTGAGGFKPGNDCAGGGGGTSGAKPKRKKRSAEERREERRKTRESLDEIVSNELMATSRRQLDEAVSEFGKKHSLSDVRERLADVRRDSPEKYSDMSKAEAIRELADHYQYEKMFEAESYYRDDRELDPRDLEKAVGDGATVRLSNEILRESNVRLSPSELAAFDWLVSTGGRTWPNHEELYEADKHFESLMSLADDYNTSRGKELSSLVLFQDSYGGKHFRIPALSQALDRFEKKNGRPAKLRYNFGDADEVAADVRSMLSRKNKRKFRRGILR